MDERPSARADDEEWLAWASSTSGIKWSGARPACPKLLNFVFRHRFPLFSEHDSIEEAVESGEWAFLAEYDRENTCVCTNGISKNHLMRHVPSGVEIMIGTECFDRYFVRRRPEYRKERTNRRKYMKTIRSDTENMDEQPFGDTTSRDAFDSGHVAVAISQQENLWHEITRVQAAARVLRQLSTYSATSDAFKSKSEFAVLALTTSWQVNYCRNKYDGRSSTSDFALFKRYLAAKDIIESTVDKTFELHDKTHAVVDFKNDSWSSNFPSYVTTRSILQELDSSADRETHPLSQ